MAFYKSNIIISLPPLFQLTFFVLLSLLVAICVLSITIYYSSGSNSFSALITSMETEPPTKRIKLGEEPER